MQYLPNDRPPAPHTRWEDYHQRRAAALAAGCWGAADKPPLGSLVEPLAAKRAASYKGWKCDFRYSDLEADREEVLVQQGWGAEDFAVELFTTDISDTFDLRLSYSADLLERDG